MNNVVFLFETFNPNKRTTFFKHKSYINYLAYSEYAIRNSNTAHGLFGKVNVFPNIQEMNNLESINNYITELAKNKVPIYRCTISLDEYDAIRLGFDQQEKWKELFESKLVSFAKKMNIKYEDLQYAGAVHLESGHPHLQVMMWSKQQYKMNYYISYKRINQMRDEFTNAIFRDDLIELYKEKDLAKKNIIAKNKFINKLKKISNDNIFINDILKYENNFNKSKIMKQVFKDEELKQVAIMLVALKKELQDTTGSIKYEYLKSYYKVITMVNQIADEIIQLSYESKLELENYIKAKQKILEYKYSDKEKLQIEKEKIRIEIEKEILKLIGNKILDFERKLLNVNIDYSNDRYINESKILVFNIYNLLCSLSYTENCRYNIATLKYKKQLSKQAKKEKALKNKTSSSWNWEF